MKLLIVDDEKIVGDSIRLTIEREGLIGIDLMAVATGGAAIEAAGNFRPDAIFMDIDMPGFEWIGGDPEYPKVCARGDYCHYYGL